MPENLTASETNEQPEVDLQNFYNKLPGEYKWEIIQERQLGQDILGVIQKLGLDMAELKKLQDLSRGRVPDQTISTADAKVNLNNFIRPIYNELIAMGRTHDELAMQ